MPEPQTLSSQIRLTPDAVLTPAAAELYGGVARAARVLVLLAAGKGTRFGPFYGPPRRA